MRATELVGVVAPAHRPENPRAAVLVVHGLSPAGNRHPELVRLARLFARHGYVVMAPHFDGLASFRLSGREIDEIRAALADLRRRSATVAVAGFSFGAGPALVAAADTDGLAWVGSFGGYADLGNVIVYLTTGAHTFHDLRHTGRVEEYNRWKLAALLTPFVDDEHDRERVANIASRRLANPSADTDTLAAQLGPSGRAVMSRGARRAMISLTGRSSRACRRPLSCLVSARACSSLTAPTTTPSRSRRACVWPKWPALALASSSSRRSTIRARPVPGGRCIVARPMPPHCSSSWTRCCGLRGGLDGRATG